MMFQKIIRIALYETALYLKHREQPLGLLHERWRERYATEQGNE